MYDNVETIAANLLMSEGATWAGVAGVLGNLYCESALNPKNLQNTYESLLGYTDNTYTDAVDRDLYDKFVYDQAGYGLAQWTYRTRKKKLLDYTKSKGKSIGDAYTQIQFLIKEMKEDYPGVWKTICTTESVKEACEAVMLKYESPADQSETARYTRFRASVPYYNMLVQANGEAAKIINAPNPREEEAEIIDAPETAPVSNMTDKKTVKVTIWIDDHEYSGLLEEQ